MSRSFRAFLYAVCAIQAIFGVAYAFRMPWAIQLWPLIYTTNLSFIFIGSIFVAAAVSTLWVLLTRENGTLAGIALDYLTIFGPLSIFVFQIAGQNQALRLFGVECVGGAILGLVMLWWSWRIPIRDPRPMPGLVRVAFVIFVVALVLAGSALLLKTPNVLPWLVSAEDSVIYGWTFLGAASYFAYGLVRPSWANTGGQLAGFLAYDLVLIGPLVALFPTVAPQYLLSLTLYTAALSFSGLLAIYYLFVNPATRVWNGRTVSAPIST